MSYMKWGNCYDTTFCGALKPGAKIIESPDRPTKTGLIDDSEGNLVEGEVPDYDWFPIVNFRRVHGCRYTPYKGDSEWVKAANRSLREAAQNNFMNRR